MAKRLTATERLLRESLRDQALLREQLYDLELELQDGGWRRFAQTNEREFSRGGLRAICQLSRLMFLKNPLINRAVNIQAMYVWAQGVSVTSDDPGTQQVISDFWDDQKNQCELTGHQARTMKEQDLQVLGNLFFAFFTDILTGGVQLRSIGVDEIEEIICDPDDSKSPWYYKRTWQQRDLDLQTGKERLQPMTVYYPALGYEPAERYPAIAGNPVLWDTPVYHVRVGGLSDMCYGVPEVYQAIDWARSYSAFLEDWATIVRAYSRFAWNLKTTGGARGVASAKSRLNTTLAPDAERNPPAVTGSTFISSGAEMAPIRTAGATTSAEDGRRMLLMVAAASGLPETFFGDMSTGNLATAKSLDRPTELKFRDRQELWRSVLQTILQYVVARSSTAVGGRLAFQNQAKTEIKISFPPILEHDIAETIGGIVSGATLDGQAEAATIPWKITARLILEALGVQDVEAAVTDLEVARAEKIARAEKMQLQLQQQRPNEETPDERDRTVRDREKNQ